jgi:hypothetical protein
MKSQKPVEMRLDHPLQPTPSDAVSPHSRLTYIAATKLFTANGASLPQGSPASHE